MTAATLTARPRPRPVPPHPAAAGRGWPRRAVAAKPARLRKRRRPSATRAAAVPAAVAAALAAPRHTAASTRRARMSVCCCICRCAATCACICVSNCRGGSGGSGDNGDSGAGGAVTRSALTCASRRQAMIVGRLKARCAPSRSSEEPGVWGASSYAPQSKSSENLGLGRCGLMGVDRNRLATCSVPRGRRPRGPHAVRRVRGGSGAWGMARVHVATRCTPQNFLRARCRAREHQPPLGADVRPIPRFWGNSCLKFPHHPNPIQLLLDPNGHSRWCSS